MMFIFVNFFKLFYSSFFFKLCDINLSHQSNYLVKGKLRNFFFS
jgi:hypothetical protein